jgi:hypothetical protein
MQVSANAMEDAIQRWAVQERRAQETRNGIQRAARSDGGGSAPLPINC